MNLFQTLRRGDSTWQRGRSPIEWIMNKFKPRFEFWAWLAVGLILLGMAGFAIKTANDNEPDRRVEQPSLEY